MSEQTLQTQTANRSSSAQHSTKTKILIAIVVVLLFLVALGTALYIVLTKKTEGSQSFEVSTDLCRNVDTGMADLWKTYTDPEWDFTFEYPRDLQTSKSDGDEVDVITVSPGGDIYFISFITWVWETDDIDSKMAEIMMPACYEDISYEDVKYGNYTFRKATAENVDLTCAGSSLSEGQSFVSFAYEIEDDRYLILRNDGLTEEQLGVVMCTLDL